MAEDLNPKIWILMMTNENVTLWTVWTVIAHKKMTLS